MASVGHLWAWYTSFMKTAFDKLYKALNPEQKKAVDAVEGAVMVIAGPGTGKTQILTLRIANILKKTDTAPENILALTFTEFAAFNMRRRLAEIIGNRAYKVNFHTFHSFANGIIGAYPEYFPRIVGSASATDIDQIRLMEKVLESLSLKILKPYGDPFYYLQPALQEIKNLKRDDITPEQYEKLVKTSAAHAASERDIEKNEELAKIYRAYESALRKGKLYDYEDMIMETVRVLRANQDLLLRLQENYQYILADEHQDANYAQNKILELLSNFHPNPNLFIVGDEKQAIFRFQGASLENFLYFKKLHPKALMVRLVKNYRSHQTLLDAAGSLIEHNVLPDKNLRVALKAAAKIKPEKIKVYEFSLPRYEYAFLAEDIKKQIEAGTAAHEIAVIFRQNSDAAPAAEALARAGVPHVVESGQHVLDDIQIDNLVALLRAVADPAADQYLSRALLFGAFELLAIDAYKIIAYGRKKRLPLWDIISNAKMLTEAGVEKKVAVADFTKRFSRWLALAGDESAIVLLEKITTESGFVKHLLSLKNSAGTLRKLRAFFAEARKLAGLRRTLKLHEFLAHLDTLATHNIRIEIEGAEPEKQGVRLMTAHKAKGLEFDAIYILNAEDGHWGNKRAVKHFKLPNPNQPDQISKGIDDERRLFYVALTRAKKHATILYSLTAEDGRARLPSEFIAEINPKFIEKMDAGKFERSSNEKNLEEMFLPASSLEPSLSDKAYIQGIFLEQGLSVTALNNYLECPWKYFFTNLVRLPQEETKHQLYGTAIHETLKIFFDKYRLEENMPKKALLALFESLATRKPFSKIDLAESVEKGKKALGGWFDFYKNTWPRRILTEFGVAGIPFANIHLCGNLDKIELNADETVSVIDYKTRAPQSRNEIEGKTKNSNGNYKRQLVFYKLLLDGHEGRSFKMKNGVIDFIEPNSKGDYRRESFEITSEDTKNLKETLARVVREIYNLEFWDKTCDDSKCEFCGLKNCFSRPGQ